MNAKTFDLLSDPLLAAVPVCEGYKVLGGVVLYQKLGQGGMGAVYKGKHARLNVDVAVKVMATPAGLPPDQVEAFVKRFIREAQTAAAVSHQNLIRVYDVNAEAGVYFLIMDFVDGESALERLKRKGALPESEAVEICLGAAEGLAEAHRKGIVHRDVKPDNIMIDREGRVRVTDLGLAKAYSGEEDSNRPTMLTQTQTAMGTPYYMSPEQFTSARDVGPAADVWSLGVTLYQLLTGELPWSASSVYLLAGKVMNEPLPDPRTKRPELSEGVVKLIEKATQKSPQERFKDCSEMAAALRAHLETIKGPGGTSLADPEAGATRLALAAMTPPTVNTMSLVSRSLAQIARTPTMKPPSPDTARALTPSPSVAPAAPPVRRVTGMLVAKTGLIPLIVAGAVAGSAIVGVALFFALGAYSKTRDEREDAAAWQKTKAEAEAKAAEEDYAGALAAILKFISSAKTDKFKGEAEELRLRYDERLKSFAEESAWNRTQAEVEAFTKASNFGAALAAVDGFLVSVKTERLRRAAAALRKDIEDKKKAFETRAATERKISALVASAKTLRGTGLLDQAREKLVEALALSPDHTEAKRMLEEIQNEINSRKAEAERATEYRRWMDRGLELKLSGKLLEAAEAFGRAAQHAPKGSREAIEAASACLHDYYKAQAAEAENRGDFARAVALYEKALEQKHSAEVQTALEMARQKLAASRAEEARRAEAARIVAEAEAAEKAGELRKAIMLYRQASELGFDAAAKIRELEAELRYRELMERARALAAKGEWKELVRIIDSALAIRPGDQEAKRLFAEAAKHVGPKPVLEVTFGGGLTMQLVYVKPGRFTMGSIDGPEEERPVREVEITKGFYFGMYEVTQAQYERLMDTNPSEPKGANLPVTNVSWADAVEFCRKLSAAVGRRFRLPTEAEWEYAARGSEGRIYPWGNEPPDAERANIPGPDGKFAPLEPVGRKPKGSTPLGLADMAGNVAEWCLDWYGPYDPAAVRDPTGPVSGTSRVVRGGAYKLNPSFAKTSARGCRAPDKPLYLIGFRVLGELTDEERAFEKHVGR